MYKYKKYLKEKITYLERMVSNYIFSIPLTKTCDRIPAFFLIFKFNSVFHV